MHVTYTIEYLIYNKIIIKQFFNKNLKKDVGTSKPKKNTNKVGWLT